MVVRVIGVLAVLAVFALYALFTAQRLDRLHARIDAAAAALDAQLLRRAQTAEIFAGAVGLPADEAQALVAAAVRAHVAAVGGLGRDRELMENALSRFLAQLVERHPQAFTTPSEAATEMHDESLRAAFARQFYNDTVRDALTVRDRRMVRWLRLAGTAPHPSYFEMDDEELPAPLTSGVAASPYH